MARHALMGTLRCTYVIVALTLLNVARAGETTLAAVLSDPAGFDGQQVQVRGILTDLKAQRSRKSGRYYTFNLSEDEHTVLILVSKRPDCAAESWVTVNGTIKHLRAGGLGSKAVVIDAAAVTCLARKKSQLDALAAFADDRHPGSDPESGPPRETAAK